MLKENFKILCKIIYLKRGKNKKWNQNNIVMFYFLY